MLYELSKNDEIQKIRQYIGVVNRLLIFFFKCDKVLRY